MLTTHTHQLAKKSRLLPSFLCALRPLLPSLVPWEQVKGPSKMGGDDDNVDR